jgi:hypothetical protein
MRFEVSSALLLGVAMPSLATCLDFCRRNFTMSFADVRGNLDDYVAGAMLLIAGWLAVKSRSISPVFSVLAWAYFTSLMFASSWGQIDDTLGGHAEEYNALIIGFKVAILAVAVISLVLAVRHAKTT